MTILFLARRFYPLIGGVEKHVFEISQRLIKKGHHVIVITEKTANLQYFEKLPSGLEIYRIQVGNEARLKKFKIWKELWKLKDVIRKSDVIHCHDVFFWYLPFRFVYLKKPVYTTFHGYETTFPPVNKARRVRKLSELLSYGNIIVGDFIKKWYGTKPDYVTYGGVAYSKNNKPRRKNINKKIKIIFVGRLEKDTGFSMYLKAIKKLKSNKQKFTFDIYGDGSLRKEAIATGKEHGFIKDTSFAVQNADIVFASSYLAMLEALLRKKIVIAAYENELKEDYLKMSPFVRYVFICKDADEIRRVLYKIQNDSWKTNAMLENGFKWASLQTWENVADQYLKLWKLTTK